MPDLTIPTAGGQPLRAYLSEPPVGRGPWPGLVVVHDVFGLSSVTRDHADRLAAAGYLALAPDLYSQGGMARCVRATFAALRNGYGPAYEHIDAARRWLEDQAACTGRTGIIGFCMGGGFALMTANRGFAVSAPNYGELPKDLGAALDGACPVVASYGARDRALPGAAAKLEAALAERGIPHDVKEYPDAGHGFLDRLNLGPLAPVLRVAGLGYHQPSAADAWARILAFFAEHLVAPVPATAPSPPEAAVSGTPRRSRSEPPLSSGEGSERGPGAGAPSRARGEAGRTPGRRSTPKAQSGE